ncbi:MAG TPA: TerC family protein [Propionibacteriaceae bacterium]|nr:TerC family protein [Propionibacteriaceae bacterium]
MQVHASAWIITVAVMAALLAVDVLIIGRRPHVPSMRECTLLVGLFVALAVLFGSGIWVVSGPVYGKEFFAGWLTEYSLSVDNLFIFLLIMDKFRVPARLQQFGLLVGIILALVFRGVFIGLGAAMIASMAWVFFLFGAFLLYTAVDLVRDYLDGSAEEEEATENLVMRFVRRRFPASEEFHGTRLTVQEGGRRLVTPMLIVIVALGTTDVMFALDSIPAIYGLTQEPYLVFTANVFALMGLRQLYFLLGGMLKKLVYLPLGLAVILAFIGVKLLLHAAHHYRLDRSWHVSAEIPVETSLLVIVVTLAVTVTASLLRSRSAAE